MDETFQFLSKVRGTPKILFSNKYWFPVFMKKFIKKKKKKKKHFEPLPQTSKLLDITLPRKKDLEIPKIVYLVPSSERVSVIVNA